MSENRVTSVPYSEALAGTKTIDLGLFELAKQFH